MNRCSRCQINNRADSRFCTSCGLAFTPVANAVSPVKSKTNPLVIGAIVLGVLLSCGMCGIIGKLGDNPKNSSSVATASVKNTTALSQTPISSASPEPAVNSMPRTLVSQPANKSKTAIVITNDAGVFEEAKSSAKEIQKLTGGTNVEVIKQKGAWFYVSIDGQKGWMHGNTIRYENLEPDVKAEKKSSSESPKTTYSESPKISQKSPEPEINNSGATAKCRDGSLSYSAHRRGTCSHHGGVAVWY